jgi:hypothetical protein
VGDSHLNKLAAHVVPEILFGVTRGGLFVALRPGRLADAWPHESSE